MTTTSPLSAPAAPLRIVIPGGTGLLGRMLTSRFRGAGHRVTILSRNVESPGLLWDGRTLGDWAAALDGADVVINLAGRSVDCRYDAKHRGEILWSRVDSTRVIGEAIALAARPPRVWLQASTATIYAHRYDAPNDEHTGILGGGEPEAPETWRFSIDLARAWERAFDDSNTARTRKIALRSAMTMSPDAGGIFDTLAGLVRRGLQ